MIRKIAMIAGILMVSSACVFAMPERAGKVDAGFQVGGLLSTAGALDSAVYFGGSVAYGVNEWFAVGLESGFADGGTDFSIAGSKRDGKISRIPLFFDLIVRYAKEENEFVPYGVLGLGALFTNLHGTGTFDSANLKLDVDNSFAIKIGAGIDWFVNDRWILNFEASYVWVDADATVTNLASASPVDSANMDYWTIAGGAKYLFD